MNELPRKNMIEVSQAGFVFPGDRAVYYPFIEFRVAFLRWTPTRNSPISHLLRFGIASLAHRGAERIARHALTAV